MRRDVYVFVFIIGLLAFNWPFLKIFSGHNLPVYLFAAWAVFIGIHALASFFSPDG